MHGTGVESNCRDRDARPVKKKEEKKKTQLFFQQKKFARSSSKRKRTQGGEIPPLGAQLRLNRGPPIHRSQGKKEKGPISKNH